MRMKGHTDPLCVSQILNIGIENIEKTTTITISTTTNVKVALEKSTIKFFWGGNSHSLCATVHQRLQNIVNLFWVNKSTYGTCKGVLCFVPVPIDWSYVQTIQVSSLKYTQMLNIHVVLSFWFRNGSRSVPDLAFLSNNNILITCDTSRTQDSFDELLPAKNDGDEQIVLNAIVSRPS